MANMPKTVTCLNWTRRFTNRYVKRNLETRKSILYYLNVGTLNDKMTLVISANFDSGLCIDGIAMQHQFDGE